MPKIYIFIIGLLLHSNIVSSQDTTKTKKVKILPVPAFGYSPETSTYIGAITLFTFHLYKDTVTRTSNAKVEFNYTWNKQVILECGWNYFFKEEKWFTKGLIHYSKYPDLYYGVGSNTPDSNKLIFNSNRFIFEAQVLKKIGNKLFTGVNVKYIDYAKLNSDKTVTKYPELLGGSTFGVGYAILKDSRNNLLTPTKGAYIYFNTAYNFSKKNYWEIVFDMRYYKTWKDRFTIASRFINDFNLGNPPFYDYAFLGGDKFVRGYYYGRYRDNNLSSLQTECRLPIVWRFGLATFGGLSNLYSSKNKFNFINLKYNYGLGLRFLVDRKDKTNLRLDYAVGSNNNNGFYVSFGESF
jgi:hypothetical protein